MMEDGDPISQCCGAIRRAQRSLDLVRWAVDSTQSFVEGFRVTIFGVELYLFIRIEPAFVLSLELTLL